MVKRSSPPRFLLSALSALVLTGCGVTDGLFDFSDDPPPLKGERISVMELQEELEPDNIVLETQGFVFPSEWANDFWPQAGGYPNHSMQHVALGDNLQEIWSTRIGRGGSDRLPLTAQPIVVDGRIFTLDTDSILAAFNIANGESLWQSNVRDPNEDDPVLAGGISYSSGKIFVTNGYNELLSVNPENGEILWRQALPTPSRAAPTVMDGRIFVTTLDNRLQARDINTGDLLWEHQALSENAGLVGAASPAANRDIVVPVFSSGELIALRVENGSVAWSDNLSNVRGMGGGLSNIADIRALPVIDQGIVFAVSFGGRLLAIDERTGSRLWQRDIGSAQTLWVAGNHVFLISTNQELVALGRETGTLRWVTQLPEIDDDDPVTWAGPIFAGSRLFVFGSEGQSLTVNPENGEIMTQGRLTNRAVNIAPVVAGATLYLLNEDGRLSAYRGE